MLLIACGDEARRVTTETAPPIVEPTPIADQQPDRPERGETAPDFTLKDHHGRTVSLSENRGQNVVLVFYRGHW